MKEEQKCPNCFSGNITQGKCQACGYDKQEEKRNPMGLPEMFQLNQRYLIGRMLGCGGFGITYKAYDMLNRRCCAIKEFVPAGLAVREGNTARIQVVANAKLEDFEHGKKRFMEEAEVLKKLMFVSEVVQITDYFAQNNTAYFVMEYVEGATLKQLMASFGGRIPFQEAAPIFYQVGMALEQVHKSTGIFHRDISPDNIMVNQNGKVKIIDFGNAKHIIGRHSQNLSVILKHGYAPPEQYSSASSQGSYTDVYALAATFYYVVTGIMIPNAPDRFGGEEYCPLPEILPEVGREISDALNRALVLNSKNRTQSAAEFVQALPFGRENAKANIFMPSVQELPYLKLLGGREYTWNIPKDKIMMIGRSNELADIIPTKDGTISKTHCELFCDSIEKKFYLVDCSTNGTFIDNRRLKRGAAYVLEHGARFCLGNHVCDLEVGWRNG